jgi:hypothetical protein
MSKSHFFNNEDFQVLNKNKGNLSNYQKSIEEIIASKNSPNVFTNSMNSYRIQVKQKEDSPSRALKNLYDFGLNTGPFTYYKVPGVGKYVKNTFEGVFGYHTFEKDEEGFETKVEIENCNFLSDPNSVHLPVDVNQNMLHLMITYPFVGFVGYEFSRYELGKLFEKDLIEVVKITSDLTALSSIEKDIQLKSGSTRTLPLLSAVYLPSITNVVDITNDVYTAFVKNSLITLEIGDYNEQLVYKGKEQSSVSL